MDTSQEGRGAACWPSSWEQRSGRGSGFGLARASTGGLRGTMCMPRGRGSGATLQDRGHVTGTRGSHNDAALAS